MGIYTGWRDVYKRETTWGTSTITTATDQTYLFGLMGDSEATIHPSPVATSIYAPTAVNTQEVAAGRVWKNTYTSSGMYSIGAQNGVLLQMVMGKSATVDDNPVATVNTHTITPPTAVAGILPPLPSFTIHHEKTGTGTTWVTQYLGCKVASLTLFTSIDAPILLYRVDWINQKATDPNLDGTNAVLSTTPILPAVANAQPYLFENMTVTYDSLDISEYVVSVQLEIKPGLEQIWANAEEYPVLFLENYRKEYTLTLQLTPYADDMWDELLASSNTKDMTIKWTRHATNDFITATLSDLLFVAHPQITPVRDQMEVVEVIAEPRTVSFTVVDKLEGSDYGE